MPSWQALRTRGCEPVEWTLPGPHSHHSAARKRLERRTAAGESPVRGRAVGEPPPLKYHATREIAWEAGPTTVQGYLLVVTDSAQYREGTVKSTPARGVKQSLKPTASMQ